MSRLEALQKRHICGGCGGCLDCLRIERGGEPSPSRRTNMQTLLTWMENNPWMTFFIVLAIVGVISQIIDKI
jgi:hypothetical protein